MYFAAVMLAPPIILYGLIMGSWFFILFAAGLGGYSLHAGIQEAFKLTKVSQTDKEVE